ncbi:SEC-C metal-binding domain-containing protein [Flagellimonas myxillae]|uniref:SEC-C metal-binding domain-containing protein n=1 Tax=Flagellimonas myxillae TaxID=2942214 RepID=UPI00201F25BD|nr:SEC-C metal-binding domain-containing protein [Muricauda myxillae]MCL6266379.1 SEC-C metal-binding domain-containing protein [Muricauda myxillae]
MKIGRNEKCPCGSGLKYKKCCLKKEIDDEPPIDFADFQKLFQNEIKDKEYNKTDDFIKNNDYRETLKVIAFLQTLPQNHTKNVRLELLIHNILSSNDLLENDEWDLEEFGKLLTEEYPNHVFEDPAEGFFTENLIFINGNNVVYSGIANDTCNVVQTLLTACLSPIFPKEFTKDVVNGSLFILDIHNAIAKELGHTHRMFEEIEDNLIYLPNPHLIQENSSLFSYTQEEIDEICTKLGVGNNIIHQFICQEPIHDYFDYENEESPLLAKPFLKIGELYYLILPTAELFCLNEFIISKAKEYQCLEKLLRIFAEQQSEVAFTWLHKCSWKRKDLPVEGKTKNNSSYLVYKEIYQIDENKLALAIFINESGSEKYSVKDIDAITKFSNELILGIKKTHPNYKVFLLVLFQKYRMLKKTIFGLGNNSISDLALCMFMSSFQVLINLWDFDTLTLWKYARQYEAVSKNDLFTNFNNHLSKMDWYMRYHHSFQHPDDAMPNSMIFDLSTEGSVKRRGLEKIDEFGIPIFLNETLGFLPCIKKDDNIPVYISYEFVHGIIRECLLSYTFPIWIKAKKGIDKKANTYINAIFYWLNEIQPSLKNFMPEVDAPIQLIIELDNKIYELESLSELKNERVKFSYSLDLKTATINFKIPFELIDSLSTANNEGERILVAFIIDVLSDFMNKAGKSQKISIPARNKIINTHIPQGNKKMILMPTGGDRHGMLLANIDIEEPRFLQKAERSFILENQLKWYGKEVSEETIELDKNSFLNELSFLHLKRAISLIKEFNISDLLPYIIKKHESLIQNKFFRHVYYPARLLCYDKYIDVRKEFYDSEKEHIETSLIYRILIEFVIAENPTGTKSPNKEDLDLVLSYLSQVNNYALLSDEIRYGFQNPRIYILPSGRVGIVKESLDAFNDALTSVMYGDDFDSHLENFEDNFYEREIIETNIQKENDLTETSKKDIEEIEIGFLKDWGISLFDVYNIGEFLCEYSLLEGTSFCKISSEEFFNKTSKEFDKQTMKAFIKVMASKSRNGILNFPTGERKEEFYPWRYNRKFSYLYRPLIELKEGQKVYYAWGARHMLNSVSNLLHSFYDGTLKAENSPNINNLTAKRLVQKGSEFNEEVYDWLKTNSDLEVVGKDIWIKPKGFFSADENYGDIDILGINHAKKTIYSMECKNTVQSKLPYEYHTEIMKYFGKEGDEEKGLIRKHIKRDKWLKVNQKLVHSKLNLTEKYSIESIIITSNFLPATLIKKPSLKTHSFRELKRDIKL